MLSIKKRIPIFFSISLLIPSFLWADATTLQSYQAFSEKIITGINNRDSKTISDVIDLTPALDKAFSGLVISKEWESSFRSTIKNANLGKQLLQHMPDNGYAKQLRVANDNKIGKTLIRLDMGDSGNSYLDFHLSKTGNKISIVDWYDYSTGQLYSDLLRQIIVFSSPTPTVIGKVFDIASGKKEQNTELLTLIELYKKGEYKGLIQHFLQLDETLRKSKVLNTIVYKSSTLINDQDVYYQVLANIEKYFKNDPGMAFVLIDYYYLEGDYQKVLATTNLLRESFGAEDAGLMVINANTLIEMGNADEAEKQAARAIQLEPEYEYAYLSLVSAQVLKEHYGQAIKTAEILETRFGYDFGPESLAENETFAGFIVSEEYSNWRKRP